MVARLPPQHRRRARASTRGMTLIIVRRQAVPNPIVIQTTMHGSQESVLRPVLLHIQSSTTVAHSLLQPPLRSAEHES